MQLSSLSVAELAALVDDVYMADQGDDASRFGQDHQLLKQLHARLVESPLLADELLRC